MTPRERAEALLGRIQRGYRGVDADLADIEAFAKAQRVEECEAIQALVNKIPELNMENYNESEVKALNDGVIDLDYWLDARLKEWRG